MRLASFVAPAFTVLPLLAPAGCAPAASTDTTTSAASLDVNIAPDASAVPAVLFDWPTPPGWRSERIPFPLAFAPTIPHRGAEELRFAPRFFRPDSPTYFTYAFAFVIEPSASDGQDGERVVAFDADRFAGDLRTYFTGLARAVSKTPIDPAVHAARIVPVAADPGRPDVARFDGTVDTVDAFGDKRPLHLTLAGESFVCHGRRIILSSLSPRPATDAIWPALAAQRATFACAK